MSLFLGFKNNKPSKNNIDSENSQTQPEENKQYTIDEEQQHTQDNTDDEQANKQTYKYKDSSNIDLDKAYETFKKSYEESTGQSWDIEHFKNRASNWVFYGDENGYISLRPQNSGLYKLTGVAGSKKSIGKALVDLMSDNIPVWGMVNSEIKDMANKAGFISPPGWVVAAMIKKIPSYVFGNASIKNINSDGGLTFNYANLQGDITKYFIANRAYYQWLLSQTSSKNAFDIGTKMIYNAIKRLL